MPLHKSLGLMSGTSMDGVDLAILETDGHTIQAFGPTLFHPYTETERQTLRQALKDAPQIKSPAQRASRPGSLSDAEDIVMTAHIRAIHMFLQKHSLNIVEIDCIGFHGQTVLHRPQIALTVQLGDGEKLAAEFQTPVVYDFRQNDVSQGGQGAPFAPVYHRALTKYANIDLPLAIVNLGGVANITWIGAYEDNANAFLAFDTGPASALLDDWTYQHTGEPMDKNGAYAKAGHVNAPALKIMLQDRFFQVAPPKSLDRQDFSLSYVEGLSLQDGAATLTAFTAESLARSLEYMSAAPKLWVLTGGGTYNAHLCEVIKQTLEKTGGCHVKRAQDLGWQADFIEAQAFAYMAVRSIQNLPISFPGTTGVPQPLTGGVCVKA